MNPILTWFVVEGEMYKPKAIYNAGMVNNNEMFIVNLQVWNNRWGIDDVESIDNPVMNIYCDNIEDSFLLDNIKIIIDEYEIGSVVNREEFLSVLLGKKLSGSKNNGDETDRNNNENFINIRLEIDLRNRNIKDNDLKSLYFEIVDFN